MKKPIQSAPRDMNVQIVAAIAGERARISSILESPQAKGRETTALKLALHSDMSADAAVDLLASTPSEQSPFARYMESVGPSGVSVQQQAQHLDKRNARLAELKETAAHLSAARGYTRGRA